jgi:hypothetical protein
MAGGDSLDDGSGSGNGIASSIDCGIGGGASGISYN